MAKYVDGYVLPIPKKNVKEYQKIAAKTGKLWRKCGALDYYESVLEDAAAKGMISFPKLAKLKKGETVVFAWVTYKSRKHRDQVNKKVMKEMQKVFGPDCGADSMPFDCRKIAYGGFHIIVNA